MTWLDEHEEDLKNRPIPNYRMDRMTRVIRELVDYIQHRSQETWDNLSWAAKELLKEAGR